MQGFGRHQSGCVSSLINVAYGKASIEINVYDGFKSDGNMTSKHVNDFRESSCSDKQESIIILLIITLISGVEFIYSIISG